MCYAIFQRAERCVIAVSTNYTPCWADHKWVGDDAHAHDRCGAYRFSSLLRCVHQRCFSLPGVSAGEDVGQHQQELAISIMETCRTLRSLDERGGFPL
jgi:hypothetical protein